MIKIVLIEDDVFLAEIYKTRLELGDFECYVANDGKSGLALIQQVMPDLVLLDLMLPQMSGDEVLAALRGSDWGKDVKVVMLTNVSEAEAPDNLRTLGIERYIVKANLQHNQLVEAVQDVLGLQPTAA